jgi:hypothetical protein
MLDKIENKFIDRLDNIDMMTISNKFDCKHNEVGGILTDYFARRKGFIGNIDLTGINRIKSLGTIRRIDGDLRVMYSDFNDLGDLRVVNGGVTFRNTDIVSTGKLIYCNGLNIYGMKFKEIKKLTEVSGDLLIYSTSIETLGGITAISGRLKFSQNSNLTSLGDIREVNGDVVIDKCDELNSLGVLKRIGGCLDVRTAKLESFGNLTNLDGFVVALKSKVGNLYESDLDIVDFEPLKTIFHGFPNCMHLKVPKIDNLKDFDMLVINDDDTVLFGGLSL